LRIYGEGSGYGELSYDDYRIVSNKSIYLTNTTNDGISNEVRGLTATNDYWRIAGGATASNAGYVEIATCDDQNEPIYVRQYSGVFSTLKRTATLLDASGNTEFPVQVTAPKFIGTLQGNADSADYATQLSFKNGRIASADLDISTMHSRMLLTLASRSMTTSKPPMGDGYIVTYGWDNAYWGAQ